MVFMERNDNPAPILPLVLNFDSEVLPKFGFTKKRMIILPQIW